jgi:hypothetical protein
MKYLKRFDESTQSIDNWCKRLDIRYYEIIDGVVYVSSRVDLWSKSLKKIPIQFGTVTENFYCNTNELKSLKGSPSIVGRDFFCGYNLLKTLEYGPKEVGGFYYCNNNSLISLKGAPKKISSIFNCNNNNLTSLEHGPEEVGGNFDCGHNKLFSLEGAPLKLSVKMSTFGNPINYIYNHFPDHNSYIESLDYNYLRGDKIIKGRFEKACKEIGLKLPLYIGEYEYIDK